MFVRHILLVLAFLVGTFPFCCFSQGEERDQSREISFEILGSGIDFNLIYAGQLTRKKHHQLKFYAGGSYLPGGISITGYPTLTTIVGIKSMVDFNANAIELGMGYTRKRELDDFSDFYNFVVFRVGYRKNFKKSRGFWNLTYTPVLALDELSSYRSGDPFYYYMIPFAGTSIGFYF